MCRCDRGAGAWILTYLGGISYNVPSGWRHRQVGKAEACKAFIPGSSPGAASIFYLQTGVPCGV
jgi:hypothetical protein